MRKGGGYIFKRNVFVWLCIITVALGYLILITKIAQKKQNYTELWRRVAELERICK